MSWWCHDADTRCYASHWCSTSSFSLHCAGCCDVDGWWVIPGAITSLPPPVTNHGECHIQTLYSAVQGYSTAQYTVPPPQCKHHWSLVTISLYWHVTQCARCLQIWDLSPVIIYDPASTRGQPWLAGASVWRISAEIWRTLGWFVAQRCLITRALALSLNSAHAAYLKSSSHKVSARTKVSFRMSIFHMICSFRNWMSSSLTLILLAHVLLWCLLYCCNINLRYVNPFWLIYSPIWQVTSVLDIYIYVKYIYIYFYRKKSFY